MITFRFLRCRARLASATLVAASLAFAAAATTGIASASEPICTVPAQMLRMTSPLVGAKAVMEAKTTFRIVALGSSSTQGTGASGPKMCYPAQLEAELNRRFAGTKTFEVANLGVGGQFVHHMLARIDRDVLSLKPDLVIWQTGVNDAIKGFPVDDFRMAMAQGIDAIRATGADVILLDAQYYPKSGRVSGFRDYLEAMRDVAREKAIPLLSRYAMMKHLVASSQYTAEQLLAPDQFHLNDLSYSCLGQLMAEAIGGGLDQAAGRTAARRPLQAAVAP